MELSRFRAQGAPADGGFGTVYRAIDLEGDGVVALKTHRAPASRAMLRREAMIHSSLNHPAIARFRGHCVADGRDWLAVEWLDTSFGDYRRRVSRSHLVTELLTEIIPALVYLQDRGVTHNDLRPANLRANERGLAIIDFGLAETKTQRFDDHAPGHLAYMAPESFFSRRGSRSDVYSFGRVLMRCLLNHAAQTGTVIAEPRNLKACLESRGLDALVNAIKWRDLDELMAVRAWNARTRHYHDCLVDLIEDCLLPAADRPHARGLYWLSQRPIRQMRVRDRAPRSEIRRIDVAPSAVEPAANAPPTARALH